jgi:hypothetical protein
VAVGRSCSSPPTTGSRCRSGTERAYVTAEFSRSISLDVRQAVILILEFTATIYKRLSVSALRCSRGRKICTWLNRSSETTSINFSSAVAHDPDSRASSAMAHEVPRGRTATRILSFSGGHAFRFRRRPGFCTPQPEPGDRARDDDRDRHTCARRRHCLGIEALGLGRLRARTSSPTTRRLSSLWWKNVLDHYSVEQNYKTSPPPP